MSLDDRYPPHPYAMPTGPGPAPQGPGAAPYPGMHGPGPGVYPAPPAMAGYGGHAPYPPEYAHYGQRSSSFLNLGSDRFLKGLLIGAAATYLVTNESVQRAAIKGAVKAWTLMQGGAEELKERFQDAEAELRAAEAAGTPEGE